MENQTKDIRKKYLGIRNEINTIRHKEESEKASRTLHSLISEKKIKKVLCFYPLGSEINLLGLYEVLLQEGYELFFPVTSNNLMDFYRVRSLDLDFERGEFGIMVPKSLQEAFIYDSKEPVFCIVPGLAFDKELNRIGYGKGFYDRFLSNKPSIIKCGACFEAQITDELEPKVHDVPLDYVVTDKKIYM